MNNSVASWSAVAVPTSRETPLWDGQRLCPARRDQPQRVTSSEAVEIERPLRLVPLRGTQPLSGGLADPSHSFFNRFHPCASGVSRHVGIPAAVQDFTLVQRAERGRSPSAARTTRTRPVNSQGVGATNRCEPGRFARRRNLPLRCGVILERFVQGRSDGKQATPKCAAKLFGHGCDRLYPI